MALVTFMDSQGVRWHAWDITGGRFANLQSNYLGAEYRQGWLCFETEDGGERRRLANYPEDWASLPPAHLEQLCSAAQVVTGRTASRAVPRYVPGEEPKRHEGM